MAASERSRAWLWGGCLAGLVLAVYWPSLRGPFFFDDTSYIRDNGALESWSGLPRIWMGDRACPQYYPLTFTIFWLARRLWGLEPLGYHALNIALHAANAILLWRLLEKLRAPGSKLAGAIFAAHPVAVETVASMVQMKTALSTMFSFFALLAYLRFLHGRRRAWYWATFGLFLLAMFSKTAACTLPLLLLLLRWKLGRGAGTREWARLAPFFLAAAALGLMTMGMEEVVGPQFDYPLLWRLIVVGRALWFYAWKIFSPANLSFIYPRWSVRPGDWMQWLWPLAAAGGLAAVWRRREAGSRFLAVGIGFFVISLLPTVGFLNVFYYRFSYVADHFQYQAAAGLIALGAGLLTAFGTGTSSPMLRSAVSTFLVLWLGLSSAGRAALFALPVQVWEEVLRQDPRSAIAHNEIGVYWSENGRLERALGHFAKAAEYDRWHGPAYANLGIDLQKMGRYREALRNYQEAMASDPFYPTIQEDMAVALMWKGDLAGAIRQLRISLRLRPNSPKARLKLEDALRRQNAALASLRAGDLLRRQGHLDQAAAAYREALFMDPGLTEARTRMQELARP